MKVLIVDDTNTLRSLVQIYLIAHGWEFAEAQNGADGLEKARALRPDVIVSDVKMPVMDGFELCAAIRSDPDLAQTPVVLLTMFGDEASRQRGRLVGATAFLTKPIAPDKLRDAVRAAVARNGGR
ncbi:MAG TPA: response regulator [Anaeromyxobacter sp.]|nr:response regulator [Anaeromyxobacter sp.]